jgi:hypothetical protein
MVELPGLGHEGRKLVEVNAARESRQHVTEVGDGVEADQSAGAEDRIGNGRSLPASMRAVEEEVAPSDGGPSMQSLDERVVDG